MLTKKQHGSCLTILSCEFLNQVRRLAFNLLLELAGRSKSHCLQARALNLGSLICMNLCTCAQKFDHNHSKPIGDCKSLAAYMEMKISTLSYWHQTRCILKGANGRSKKQLVLLSTARILDLNHLVLILTCFLLGIILPCLSSCSWVVKDGSGVTPSYMRQVLCIATFQSFWVFGCCQRVILRLLAPLQKPSAMEPPNTAIFNGGLFARSCSLFRIISLVLMDLEQANETFFQVSTTTTMFTLCRLCSMMCPPSLHHIGGCLLHVIYAPHMHRSD